ncbi:MAG: EscU/YscU/HrcU family type III secretion system export apparatus switch protein, partial [Treponema porcinum]|nr:EscU/YscU/HrcU family type III secretion system export apparatus switch protein [Treponema porcinum]
MSFQDIDLQWFAAEDEGRTEEPSEYKLRKAREEGRIPKSQDLNSSVVFFVTVILLIFLAKSIFISCTEIMRIFFTRCTENNVA